MLVYNESETLKDSHFCTVWSHTQSMRTLGGARERDLLVLISGKKRHEAAMGVHPPWSSRMILCRAPSVGKALIDIFLLSLR